MTMTREQWTEIQELEQQIGRIFDTCPLISISTGRLMPMGWIQKTEEKLEAIPSCCFPGGEGYHEILKVKAKINRIRKGRT